MKKVNKTKNTKESGTKTNSKADGTSAFCANTDFDICSEDQSNNNKNSSSTTLEFLKKAGCGLNPSLGIKGFIS